MSLSARLHVQWHHGSYCNEDGRSSRHGSIGIHFRTQMWPHNVAIVKTSTTFMFIVNTWKTSRKIRIFFTTSLCFAYFQWGWCYVHRSLPYVIWKSHPDLWEPCPLLQTWSSLSCVWVRQCAGEWELKPERHCFWKLSFLGFCFYGSEGFWYSTSFFSPSGVFWKAAEQEMEVGKRHPKLCR